MLLFGPGWGRPMQSCWWLLAGDVDVAVVANALVEALEGPGRGCGCSALDGGCICIPAGDSLLAM